MSEATARQVRTGILKNVLLEVIFCAAPFVTAGTLAWPRAWIYTALNLAGSASSTLILFRMCPDLLAERSAMQENVKRWDRFLAPANPQGAIREPPHPSIHQLP